MIVFLGPSLSHYNLRLTERAKMTESGAKHSYAQEHRLCIISL